MRREQNSRKWEPAMPPVLVGRFLLDYLWEIGPVKRLGMGIAEVEWSDIEKWSELTGIDLSAWQARTIRRLSADYVNESSKATKSDAEEPWDTAERIRRTTEQRQALKEE